MLNYQPTSRRPIAAMFRRTANLAVQICVKLGVHPDAISYASIAFSAAAAICFWRSASRPWLLIIGPLFCYVRLWLNMLDGMVALAAHKASLRGEILNDLPDRVSDVLIFVGVAHSGLCNPFAGYWVAIMALFTAYVGTLGQAVGARREYGGVMSKPWRMVALHVGAWTTWASLHFCGEFRLGRLTMLDWTCLIIIAGCVETVAVRLRRIFAALNEKRTSETSAKQEH
jgi:phosphatidylglycerophosphate synthase